MNKAAEGHFRFDDTTLTPDDVFARLARMFENQASSIIFPFGTAKVKRGYAVQAGVELELATMTYGTIRPGEIIKWRPQDHAFSLKLFVQAHSDQQRSRSYEVYEFKVDRDAGNQTVLRLRIEHRDFHLSQGVLVAALGLLEKRMNPVEHVRLVLEKIPYMTEPRFSGTVIESEDVPASRLPSWERLGADFR